MKAELVYVFPQQGEPMREHAGAQWQSYAERFAGTYLQNPPGVNHQSTVVVNGEGLGFNAALFFCLRQTTFLQHDNTGQDIGAFILAAGVSTADLLICCGAYAYFPRPGWLSKILDYWRTFGPGLYATAVMPTFVRTAGFICPPSLLREYPLPVVTGADRYAFEFGPDSLTQQALRRRMPVLFINWNGAFPSATWASENNRDQLIV